MYNLFVPNTFHDINSHDVMTYVYFKTKSIFNTFQLSCQLEQNILIG